MKVFAIMAIGLAALCVRGGQSDALVELRQPGKSALKVRMAEPVVVAVASRPEKWGFFQFPKLVRWEDGTLAAGWHLAADSIVSYGSETSGSAVSRDGGKTWTSSGGERGVTGLLLPNGDRIRVLTPKAIKTTELRLPEPAGEAGDTYSKAKQTLYRLSELPPEVQGVCLSRIANGQTKAVPERAVLDDPQALRYSLQGLFPIVWWGDLRVARDGSVVAGIYPGFLLREDDTVDPKCGVFFYHSIDAGRSWTIQGRIPYQPDLAADPRGAERMGFTEPAFEVLADGTFYCVARTTDGIGNGPMYASRSRDMGRTWSRPEVIAPSGVLPHLLRLGNGVLVLSSGRPGVQLRFCADGRGERWTGPVELLPYAHEKDQVSCGYTSLLATGPDRFLIIYSDFKHPTPGGELRKAIKVREVTVTPAQAKQLRAPKWRE